MEKRPGRVKFAGIYTIKDIQANIRGRSVYIYLVRSSVS